MVNAFNLIALIDLSAVILFLSSCRRYSSKTASVELIITLVFALIFETYNITINQHYTYPNDFFYLGNVSVSVLFGWYSVLIISKYFTTLLLSTSQSQSLEKSNPTILPLYIVMTALIGAVFVTFFDPLATRLQWWVWEAKEPTPYLGIPIGEIYGVFLAISIILTLIVCIRILLLKEKLSDLQLRFKTLSWMDLFIIVGYEIFCLLIFYWNIITSTSNEDVLMGTLISYLGTQIVPCVIGLLYVNNGKFDEFYDKIYSKNRTPIIILTISLLIFTFLLLILTLLATFRIILPTIESIHMVLAYFLIVCITFCYLLIIKLKEQLDLPLS